MSLALVRWSVAACFDLRAPDWPLDFKDPFNLGHPKLSVTGPDGVLSKLNDILGQKMDEYERPEKEFSLCNWSSCHVYR